MPRDQRHENFDQLMLVDRATPKLEIDRHMVGDRSRRRKGVNVFGMRVDGAQKIVMIGKIP